MGLSGLSIVLKHETEDGKKFESEELTDVEVINFLAANNNEDFEYEVDEEDGEDFVRVVTCYNTFELTAV